MAVAGEYTTCSICKCEHCDLRQTGKCLDNTCSTCVGCMWRWDGKPTIKHHGYTLNCNKFKRGIYI